MSMNVSFPRLPMLQSIGRSSGIDMDEPPDDYQSADDEDKSTILKGCNVESLNALIAKFDSSGFSLANPGSYFYNRFTLQFKDTSQKVLLHCWKGAEIVSYVHNIKQLMICKSLAEFQKDIIQSLESASKLEEFMKKTALSELEMWDVICHNRIHFPVRTNLIELSDLCDDLRVQLNFWSSIWKRMFCNYQLKDFLKDAFVIMKKVKVELDNINASCFSWLNKLVTTGFRVLAHCDLDRIEYENLCNIVKGLEDYNLLVTNFRFSVYSFTGNLPVRSLVFSLPLSHMLELMANERSKYAAVSCKEYLFGNPEFLHKIQNLNFSYIDWSNHFEMRKVEQCSVDESIELDETVKGDVITKVLSGISDCLLSSYSPIMDFIRREKNFIENFLHSVCHVTTLLTLEKDIRNLKEQNNEKIDNTDFKTFPHGVLALVSDAVSHSPPSSNTQIKNSKKKNVSWNDSVMAMQTNNIAFQYFVNIWQSFVGNFKDFMEGFYWMGAHISGDHLGCLVMSHDVVALLVSETLHSATHKGMFPGVVHPCLFELYLRYSVLPSRNVWRSGFSNSASHSSSLNWCKRLIFSLGPLMVVFQNYQYYLDFFNQTSVNKVPPRFSMSFISLYHSATTCLIFSCSEAFSLCHKNILMSLSQTNLSAFLTHSRSDLQATIVQLEEAYQICMRIISFMDSTTKESSYCSIDRDSMLLQHLRSTSDEINHVLDNLKDLSNMALISFKELCFQNAIQFFKNEMPVGKIWKKKEIQTPQQHNDYIEKGVNILLQPIIISSHNLDCAERLQVLSIALHETCTAWMDNILDRKIKFSYQGACQLEKDVSFLKSWVFSGIQELHLNSQLPPPDIFDYLQGVVNLLKQQPSKILTGRNNNSNSDVSSKSISSKSASKSNSIENSSPVAAKQNESNSPKSTTVTSFPTTSSNNKSRRPSKKNRGSGKLNAPRDERAPKSNQEVKPKFGRSAKVSANSLEMYENQSSIAFTKDQDATSDVGDVLNTSQTFTSLVSKPTLDISPVSPNENGLHGDVNYLPHKGLDQSCDGGHQESLMSSGDSGKQVSSKQIGQEEKSSSAKIDDSTGIAKVFSNNKNNLCEELDTQDGYNNASSPLKAMTNPVIARRDEWLALRVRRGTRSWPRLPLCFSGSMDSCGS